MFLKITLDKRRDHGIKRSIRTWYLLIFISMLIYICFWIYYRIPQLPTKAIKVHWSKKRSYFLSIFISLPHQKRFFNVDWPHKKLNANFLFNFMLQLIGKSNVYGQFLFNFLNIKCKSRDDVYFYDVKWRKEYDNRIIWVYRTNSFN